MGSRANYVIVDPAADGGYSLHYAHWGGQTIDRDLFWGPEHAIRFARAQKLVPADDWLNSTWAEGGALIDPGRQVLMIHGAADRLLDLGRRRVYLQLLAEVWTDWAIHWAHGGPADLGDYVGVPREALLVLPEGPQKPFKLEDGAYRTAASVRWQDGAVDAWRTPRSLRHLVATGPELLEYCRPLRGGSSAAAKTAEEAPSGGIHVDVPQGLVSCWSVAWGGEIDWMLQDRWGPWRTEYVGDLAQRQTELTDGAVQVPLRDEATHVDTMIAWLSSRRQVDGAGTLAEVLKADGADNLQVNPWALREDHVPPDEATRDSVLASAVAALQGR